RPAHELAAAPLGRLSGERRRCSRGLHGRPPHRGGGARLVGAVRALDMFKALLTIGIVYAIWYGYKFRARIAAAYEEVQAEKAREAQAARAAKARELAAQELLPCPKCGAYVAVGAHCACERV